VNFNDFLDRNKLCCSELGSSGFFSVSLMCCSSDVLLVFFSVLGSTARYNTRRTPEEPRRIQKEKNTSPPGAAVK
jgi:hypothetical protein